jgi:predicted dehydrogenase
VRLGLLAAARITSPAVVEAARLVDDVEVVAVAARSLDRAEAAARDWGVPRAYGSYQQLVDDPDIDAIYIATPAALHHHWTLAALAADKDVLCEKPLAANAVEAREMVEAAQASGRLLMEAFHWRYHPLVAQVRGLLDSGRLGTVEHVAGSFVLPAGHIPPDDIRWDLSLGGGALMDLGCYPLQWVRWVVGDEPTVVSAVVDCPVVDVDGSLSARLLWPAGGKPDGRRDHDVTGSVECSMIASGEPVIMLEVTGRHGVLTVVNPLAPQFGATITMATTGGETTMATSGGETEQFVVDGADTTTYFHQLVAFRDAVTSRVAPPTSGADSIATMSLIDECYRAAGLLPRPSLVF